MEKVEHQVLAGAASAADRDYSPRTEAAEGGRAPRVQHVLAEPHRGRGRRDGAPAALRRRRARRRRPGPLSQAAPRRGTLPLARRRRRKRAVPAVRGHPRGEPAAVPGNDVPAERGGVSERASGVGDAVFAAPSGHRGFLRVRAGENRGDPQDGPRGGGGGERNAQGERG